MKQRPLHHGCCLGSPLTPKQRSLEARSQVTTVVVLDDSSAESPRGIIDNDRGVTGLEQVWSQPGAELEFTPSLSMIPLCLGLELELREELIAGNGILWWRLEQDIEHREVILDTQNFIMMPRRRAI